LPAEILLLHPPRCGQPHHTPVPSSGCTRFKVPLTASVTADTAGQGNHSELFVARQRFPYFPPKSGRYPQCLQHRHALLSVAHSQPSRGRSAPLILLSVLIYELLSYGEPLSLSIAALLLGKL